MKQDKTINRIKKLVSLCNKYCEAYYNGIGIVSDAEYDIIYDELRNLEKQTGYILSNSPTLRPGYDANSGLPKIEHKYPMLSLDKITTEQEILDFVDNHKAVMSLKEDGLSIRLYYNSNGDLITVATRGNGKIATNITSNLCCFTNIPLHINTNGKEFIIDGEAICTFSNFEKLNENLDEPYKHPRAVASGTVFLLDPHEAKKRQLNFIAWKFVQGSEKTSYGEKLNELQELGFDVVPWVYIDKEHISECILMLKNGAEKLSHPYDGICIAIDDTSIWDNLGSTSKFPHHSKAYKFTQEAEETTIRKFEFSLGKSGQLTPVAHFDSVILDNTDVSKASCHNISYCKNLRLGIGAKVRVIKAMQIVPQIIECTEAGNEFEWPKVCPICGKETLIKKENESELLMCANQDCTGKNLAKFTHFVSKNCMDIRGLSSATLETLISHGFVQNFRDIYHLADHKKQLMLLDGFGKKSVDNLLKSIESSRNVKLENFIAALGISNIGLSAAKTIANRSKTFSMFIELVSAEFDFSQLSDFGAVMNDCLYDYMRNNFTMVEELASEMKFIEPEQRDIQKSAFCGKTICVTGKLNNFNRESINEKIISVGAKVASSVSKNTDYLLTNETSSSSKYKKAIELNIQIIAEEDFLKMLQEGA